MVSVYKNNPQDFLSIVTDVQVLNWGSDVWVKCLDDPVARRPYVLIFKNCDQLRWHSFNQEDTVEVELEDNLIGILLGKGNRQEPAIITGSLFELWIWYEAFELQGFPES